MKINHGLHGLCSLTLAVWGLSAVAATGTSGEFRMDLSGMGPWEMRTARTSEAISYSTAWATNALTGANAVVKVYPAKREKPKYIAIDLSGGMAATHYPIEYLDEIPGGSWSDEYKTSKLVLRHIPAGSFIMGGRATDYPGAVNTNLHMVTLTKDFYMGVFEVTQRQWELVMGNRPSAFSNETCYATRPVECVSYVDIRGGEKGITWPDSKDVDEGSFMGQLRKKSDLAAFDLPTEAQWEYACRAGTVTALNSGKNISDVSDTQIIEEADDVARYHFNSGAALSNPVDLLYGEASDKGSATVGVYMPNAWGFYDMHGNVYELTLDAVSAFHVGGVDPVGMQPNKRRMTRGGSWNSGGYAYSSFFRGASLSETERRAAVGFRLCLQGGEIPDATKGVELVNAAGEGSANWTPTKAGTYYLTHETQTNGVNGAEVLGACFEVAGPEITFVPDGDLTPGVKIAINGVGEGWKVRYEVGNGGQGAARPTSESPEYTGPITLNDSATIRAIAFSDGGMESHEFSAAYSLMSVVGAVAKPRYPWNGKVDVDVTVTGEAGLDYLVSLAAKDLDGGTNLPVNTVVAATSAVIPVQRGFLVKPGQYRFTWDADADIAGDFDSANVAVSVSAEGSAIVAAKKVLPLEVAGYTGTETLTNVPVLVRLSEEIADFNYADFTDANGGDLIFTDESGSVVYPHEIDEWHTDGESLVWVKLPTMVNGTKFKAAWGGGRGATALPAHSVWGDYVGVWHMNEDSGTAFDSTVHGLDAQPERGTNKTVNISAEMIAYENGACGRARQNETSDVNAKKGCGNYLLTPSYDALALGSTFVASGWFRAERVVNYPRMISRKIAANTDGWEFHTRQNSSTSITIRGSSGDAVVCNVQDMLQDWVCITAMYNGGVLSCYTNGVLSASGNNGIAAIDNGLGLAIGGNPVGNENTWCGQYDEIRLRGGSLSAARIKADYDMIRNRGFLLYGQVENGKCMEPVDPPKHVSSIAIEVTGYQETETLYDIPVLVRLSAETTGFAYSGMAYPSTGADLRFTDWDENEVLPYEIDEWHTNGESLVWVKLPMLKADTKFKMFYGGATVASMNLATHRMGYRGCAVWSDYAGVWHMNEDSGTAYDSTLHGLDAQPSCCGTDTLADISQMVAYEDGACGRARVSTTETGNADDGKRFEVPSYDWLHLGGVFVASGWCRADQVQGYPKIFYRNNTSWSDGGWGAELRYGSPTSVTIVGRNNSTYIIGATAPSVLGNWVNYAFVYNGNQVSFYTNGVFAVKGGIVAPADNGLSLKIASGFHGQCDEIRLRGGSLSAARIKADYDMIKNRNFLTYGPIESERGATE